MLTLTVVSALEAPEVKTSSPTTRSPNPARTVALMTEPSSQLPSNGVGMDDAEHRPAPKHEPAECWGPRGATAMPRAGTVRMRGSAYWSQTSRTRATRLEG